MRTRPLCESTIRQFCKQPSAVVVQRGPAEVIVDIDIRDLAWLLIERKLALLQLLVDGRDECLRRGLGLIYVGWADADEESDGDLRLL